MADTTTEEDKVDKMTMIEASMWLEEKKIPYDHLVNLEEMKLRIKQHIEQEKEQTSQQDAKIGEIGFIETDVSHFWVYKPDIIYIVYDFAIM